MFHINFSPMRHDDALTLSASGHALTINGATLDLSALPEGATLPRAAVACDWLADDIERRDGMTYLTLILPHGPMAPQETRFPQPVMVEQDGPVDLRHGPMRSSTGCR